MLYANTDDGSSDIWVCDEDGVVVDNISYSIGVRAPILEQINEHFGTSFTGWSDNEIGLRIGGTIPNWDAYEKIEMSHFDIAVGIGNVYMFGHADGQEYTYSAKENGGGFPANANGIIQVGELTNPQSELYESFIQMVKTKLSDYNITTVKWESKTYQIGDQIENWESYIKV